MSNHRRNLTSSLAAACAAGLLVAAPATAAPEPKAAGGVQYVNNLGVDVKLSFTAQGTPASAKGNINFRLASGLEVKAEVDCLSQEGNQAVLSGRTKGNSQPGQFIRLVVQDNGEPGTTDLVRASRRPLTEAPFNCAMAVRPATQQVTNGNLQVLGVPASPTAVLTATLDENPLDEDF